MTSTGNTNQGAHIYATTTVPVQGPITLGATHAPHVHHATGVYRWRMVVPFLLALVLTGCIPVTIRPQFDEENKPIAIPVTPTGSISPDGTLNPIYPVSDKSPQPTNWAAIGAAVGGILSALLAAYGINLRSAVAKTRTALQIACDLADANARAETDEQVEHNKRIAASLQERARVQDLTNRVRGKIK